MYQTAAPRHQFNDTKHHRVRYTARSTSRYQEYFPKDQNLDFTRTSDQIVVDVPASTRPIAPQVAYVIPTFGWQRQTETNLKRSVRFGGGLRIYLERPWFSSGVDELLGIAIYQFQGQDAPITANRDKWKSFITQWGNDPIWTSANLSATPDNYHFPDAIAKDFGLRLEENAPGTINVVGYPVAYDEAQKRWYYDITINTDSASYTPFIRLALVRYQPYALEDAKLSRVVLADFAQLTPDRAAVVTADPYRPKKLRLTVSGVAPQGPKPYVTGATPTELVTTLTWVEVTVQQRTELESDLAWRDVGQEIAIATLDSTTDPLIRWTGTITFAQTPAEGEFRLMIREYEYVAADYTVLNEETKQRRQPRRLIYAETMLIDHALVGDHSASTTLTHV